MDLSGDSKELVEMSDDSIVRSSLWAPWKDQVAFVKYDRVTEEESLLIVNISNGALTDFGPLGTQGGGDPLSLWRGWYRREALSWSSDGLSLLWAGYPNEPDQQVHIVVLDLTDNTETLIASNLSITGNPVWVPPNHDCQHPGSLPVMDDEGIWSGQCFYADPLTPDACNEDEVFDPDGLAEGWGLCFNVSDWIILEDD